MLYILTTSELRPRFGLNRGWLSRSVSLYIPDEGLSHEDHGLEQHGGMHNKNLLQVFPKPGKG